MLGLSTRTESPRLLKGVKSLGRRIREKVDWGVAATRRSAFTPKNARRLPMIIRFQTPWVPQGETPSPFDRGAELPFERVPTGIAAALRRSLT